jgi:hypothetical protein
MRCGECRVAGPLRATGPLGFVMTLDRTGPKPTPQILELTLGARLLRTDCDAQGIHVLLHDRFFPRFSEWRIPDGVLPGTADHLQSRGRVNSAVTTRSLLRCAADQSAVLVPPMPS